MQVISQECYVHRVFLLHFQKWKCSGHQEFPLVDVIKTLIPCVLH
jgi:hypothetical protein